MHWESADLIVEFLLIHTVFFLIDLIKTLILAAHSVQKPQLDLSYVIRYSVYRNGL